MPTRVLLRKIPMLTEIPAQHKTTTITSRVPYLQPKIRKLDPLNTTAGVPTTPIYWPEDGFAAVDTELAPAL